VLTASAWPEADDAAPPAIGENSRMSALFWILLVIVAIVVFGGAVFSVGWFMLWYVIVGLVIGGLARLLVRGTGGLGGGVTIVAGLIGAVAGGWIADALDLAGLLQLLVAVLVAAALIGLVRMPGSASS
jgi:uncharacterized membrane protein YeaQ/YmgE (transglycosylase-associated protein family)